MKIIKGNLFNNVATICEYLQLPFNRSVARRLLCHTAAGCLLITSIDLQALTLSEAVNAQLETVTLPCDRLLGADTLSVLTGQLVATCARTVPFGSTPQSSSGSAANLSTLSSSAKTDPQTKKIQETTSLSSQWTLFVTVESEKLNRNISAAEDGFDSTATRLLGGATYALNNLTNLGFALTTQRHDGDYDSGGNFKTDANGFRAIASHQMTDKLFIQASAGFDGVDSKRSRVTRFEEYFNNGLVFSSVAEPKSNFNYDQTELSILTGYDYTIDNLSLTPQLGFTWQNINYGTYSETGDSGLELTFHDDQRQSLQSALGVQATLAKSTKYGVVVPQLDLRWIHEFADKSRKVNVSFTHDTRAQQFSYDTEAGDRNFFELGAGSVFVFARGKQAFIRMQTLLAHDFYDNYVISAGLNVEL